MAATSAERYKKWRDRNPELARLRGRSYRYGVSVDDIRRMIEEQDYSCACCGSPMELNIDRHIDHDHRTGKVRGLLCGMCNRMLGSARDDADILEAGAAYLRRTK